MKRQEMFLCASLAIRGAASKGRREGALSLPLSQACPPTVLSLDENAAIVIGAAFCP